MPLIYEDETYQILGACFEVYKEKGCGFHENVFQECLEIEFRLRGIPAIAKPKMKLEYKGQVLAATFEPDFICYGKIIVELKAVSKLSEESAKICGSSMPDLAESSDTLPPFSVPLMLPLMPENPGSLA